MWPWWDLDMSIYLPEIVQSIHPIFISKCTCKPGISWSSLFHGKRPSWAYGDMEQHGWILGSINDREHIKIHWSGMICATNCQPGLLKDKMLVAIGQCIPYTISNRLKAYISLQTSAICTHGVPICSPHLQVIVGIIMILELGCYLHNIITYKHSK